MLLLLLLTVAVHRWIGHRSILIRFTITIMSIDVQINRSGRLWLLLLLLPLLLLAMKCLALHLLHHRLNVNKSFLRWHLLADQKLFELFQ